MPRITRVYTRTGDDGTTMLASGERVPKTALRVEAYGTVDELNAAIGLALAHGCGPAITPALRRIQNELFHLGAELATAGQVVAGPRVTIDHVAALEQLMDTLQQDLPPLENFVLPGGSPAAAALHLARTICRRAERVVLHLVANEPVDVAVVPYLNRLSDALFVIARVENRAAGAADVLWDSRA